MTSATRDSTTPPGQPAALLNAFLTRAAANGGVTAEHVRVRSRQPENEVFVRKALVAMQRLAPAAEVASTARALSSGYPVHGRVALAAAAEVVLLANPALSRYLGVAGGAATKSAERRPGELFGLLSAYAYGAISRSMTATPQFGLAAASLGAEASGQADALDPLVKGAADSVFAQAFSDSHALVLIAVADGPRVALDVLGEVYRRREAAGDFGDFSKAPLSQDSSSALEILRAELGAGKDFASMPREERWGHSLWLATEGLATWMQKHGTSERVATSIAQAIESYGQTLAVASAQMPANTRMVVRPS